MAADENDVVVLLEELSGEAADVDINESSGAFNYSRGGLIFVVRNAHGPVEFRLSDEVADAARRTPDTAASERGSAWVRLAPADWDEHALDRLEAWFRFAWRLAGQNH